MAGRPQSQEQRPAPPEPRGARIRHLYISPGHNFFGHHGQPAGEHPICEVDRFECVAGRGVVGDRFFDHKPDYKGQITFFSWEVLVALWGALGVEDRDPSAPRRNVIAEGLELNALVGAEFAIQGVRFLGTEECRPCHWMDQAVGPGAEAFLRGQGGLRAKILTSGWLRRD
ncbi:MAG: molybdenum cofactor biosysynthesis protein [Verrucomicrobiae bacterium]|nr:molybdenum cofactor biosysynthesis protein [Verrucomicrobiae bacterium]